MREKAVCEVTAVLAPFWHQSFFNYQQAFFPSIHIAKRLHVPSPYRVLRTLLPRRNGCIHKISKLWGFTAIV